MDRSRCAWSILSRPPADILSVQPSRLVNKIYNIKFFTIYGYITNSQSDQLPVGLIHVHVAQLVEHCTGIAEVMGSNPVQA